MAFKGADTDQLRSLANKLNSEATNITNIVSQLTNAVNSVEWKGADATRFKSEWQSTHAPALKKVAGVLTTASTTAKKNASEQDSASG